MINCSTKMIRRRVIVSLLTFPINKAFPNLSTIPYQIMPYKASPDVSDPNDGSLELESETPGLVVYGIVSQGILKRFEHVSIIGKVNNGTMTLLVVVCSAIYK